MGSVVSAQGGIMVATDQGLLETSIRRTRGIDREQRTQDSVTQQYVVVIPIINMQCRGVDEVQFGLLRVSPVVTRGVACTGRRSEVGYSISTQFQVQKLLCKARQS
jgi:hypothetical protein